MKTRFFICLLFITFLSCLDKNQKDDNPIIGDEVVTFIINDFPKAHNFDEDIYISGDFEGWSGGREQFKLKYGNSKYSITIPKYRESISYKFTKGNWENVECRVDGNPIDNRRYSFEKLKDTIEIRIVNWNDNRQQNKPSTATENVQVFARDFEIPQLNRKRKITVYLPPNYNSSQENYPVLYMQDGQNVFDISTSYSGELEVDETLNKLFEETGFGFIVVAIDHGGDKRLNEYSAWENQKYGKGEGELYLDFLINTLKPEIDKEFRTKKGSKNTAIIGSSMGGLFAHFSAIKKPDIFGKAAIFSPSFWYNESVFKFSIKKYDACKSRLYYLVGSKEGDKMVKPMTDMVSLIKKYGFPEQNVLAKVVPDGVHSESFWKTEFKDAIKWLFEIDKN